MADAEDLSNYADATFDVVTCNCGLMFMPNYDRCRIITQHPLDVWMNDTATIRSVHVTQSHSKYCLLTMLPSSAGRALSEFRRVLKPGGLAMMSGESATFMLLATLLSVCRGSYCLLGNDIFRTMLFGQLRIPWYECQAYLQK